MMQYDSDEPPVHGIPMTSQAFEDLVNHPGPTTWMSSHSDLLEQ